MLKTVMIFNLVLKKKRSTSDAILLLLEHVAKSLDCETTTIVRSLLLDFSSAFNLIARRDILCSISEVAPQWIVDIMKSYFSDVYQFVRFQGSKSMPLPCNTGVVQGGVLSPFLFNLAVSDFVLKYDPRLICIKYADDTTISSAISHRDDFISYKQTILELETWAKDNNLILNGSKTKEIAFVMQCVSNPDILELVKERVTVAGVEIHPVEHAKYLGVIIDNRLSFVPQLESVILKCTRVLPYAVKLLRCTGSRIVIRDFINACVLPMLYYGLPTYSGHLSRELMRQIRSLLRRISYLIGVNSDDFRMKFEFLINRMSQGLVMNILKDASHPLHSSFSPATRSSGPETRSGYVVRPRVRTALVQKSFSYRSSRMIAFLYEEEEKKRERNHLFHFLF